MEISAEIGKKNEERFAALRRDRQPWWEHWRELADYFLPRRYIWLLSNDEYRRVKSKNNFILDATGTTAARTLASGMMNGITSPGRPWFRLRLNGFPDDESLPHRVWLDEVTRRMLLVLAESNFYQAMAVTYLDLGVFGTSAMTIYEDFDQVIHCQSHPLGEYYLAQDSRQRTNILAREFIYTVAQCVEEFGIDNVSERVRTAHKTGGARLQDTVPVRHLIEPNIGEEKPVGSHFKYREFYWESGYATNDTNVSLTTQGQFMRDGKVQVLRVRGYYGRPFISPRWEITGNDVYGSSPGMDALADVIQLQQETKEKGKSLNLMNRPPMVADIQLQNRPIALVPGGITFSANAANVGMKPAYTVQPPIREMAMDIQDVRIRIREFFHNDLFRVISQLDTVRSATEVDALREEKLVLLGPVLGRYETEALDPGLDRVYDIMSRAGLLPPPPAEIADSEIEIQYVSILSTAQRAISVAPTERLLGFTGNAAGLRPEIVDNLDWDTVLRDYGTSLGSPSKYFVPMDKVISDRQARAQQQQAMEGAAMAQQGVEGAKLLSETEVGGGRNALQELLGN